MTTLKSIGYNIYIGNTVFKSINAFLSKQNYSSCFILCDENTMQQCLPQLISSCTKLRTAEIIEIESGEASKSLEFSAYLWQTFIENTVDRKALLINLGGGVVSDLGGFTASVYKRGIDFVNISTSLLAMADASVGGKTGIDFNGLKNVLGTFAQPKAVFIYPDFLLTLNHQHYKNGLAEIYKMALIADKKLWNSLMGKELSSETLILKSVTLKNKIVQKDPFDHGIRKTLNFGHTVGHAIEALLLGTSNELLHGEAIILGMLIESHLAYQKKMLSKKELLEIIAGIQPYFSLQNISHLGTESIIEYIKNDKKNSGTKLRFALIDKIGSCKFDLEANQNQIKKALEYYNTLVK
jgi:3-dehydroquinate synthase